MNLFIYGVSQSPFIFRNASPKRQWMNETFSKHAYRCAPLTSANSHGWEVCLPHDVVVTKNDDGEVRIIEGEYFENVKICSTDIMNESVAFLHNITFVTQDGYSIWVSNPPNYFVDGAQAYTGIIPSSWWFNTFQFSWRITKIDCPVLFEKHKPIMFVSLTSNTLLSETKVVLCETESEKVETFKSNYRNHETQKRQNNEVWLSTIKKGSKINDIDFSANVEHGNPLPPAAINKNDSNK
jgi:hypothetical protein